MKGPTETERERGEKRDDVGFDTGVAAPRSEQVERPERPSPEGPQDASLDGSVNEEEGGGVRFRTLGSHGCWRLVEEESP